MENRYSFGDTGCAVVQTCKIKTPDGNFALTRSLYFEFDEPFLLLRRLRRRSLMTNNSILWCSSLIQHTRSESCEIRTVEPCRNFVHWLPHILNLVQSLSAHLAASNVKCMHVSSPPVLAAKQLENISCKCYQFKQSCIRCSFGIIISFCEVIYDAALFLR